MADASSHPLRRAELGPSPSLSAKMPDDLSAAPLPSSTPESTFPRYPRHPRSRGPRFSLRALLIAMTVIAVAVVVMEAIGIDAVLAVALFLLVLIAPVCCVTAAIYCRGRWQTFFIGAACVSCLWAGGMRGSLPQSASLPLLLMVVGNLFALALAGGIAVATRNFIERRGWNLPAGDRDRWIDE
jgi:hypothetical protein